MKKKSKVKYWPATLIDFEDERIKVSTLDQLREIIGGPIELVPCRDASKVLIVDENGRNKELCGNFRASVVAGRFIVGPAVLLSRTAFDAICCN
ncbi:MAG: hypothetical protein JNM18_12485 [Planctomycetaceae bacterium]|nr:hypothetical protein [Planctomycetaceae bacterium]